MVRGRTECFFFFFSSVFFFLACLIVRLRFEKAVITHKNVIKQSLQRKQQQQTKTKKNCNDPWTPIPVPYLEYIVWYVPVT